jgi:hypothetical protein
MGNHNRGMMSKIMGSFDDAEKKHHKKHHKKKKKKTIEGYMDEVLSELDDIIGSFKKLKHKH